MKLTMEYEENGWKVSRVMELDNDEKLAARVLNSIKKYQADKLKTAAKPEPEAAPVGLPVEAETSLLSQPSAASSSVGGASERYHGMLICECGNCHKTKAFTTKYPLNRYKCNECGESTELTDMADAELTCLTCGKTWYYKTNTMEASVEAACPKCGKPLTGWWDKKKKVYTNE